MWGQDRTRRRGKNYSIEEIGEALSRNESIEGCTTLGSARLKVEKLVPYIILCQHSGTKVTPEIEQKMLITQEERAYEADLYLDELFAQQPIEIVALHSRYEFDTNRFERDALYLTPALSWGVKVYRSPLRKEVISDILLRYKEFYRLVDTVIAKIIEKFGACVVYDIHSFNATHPDRIGKDLPMINLGTMAQNTNKYRKIIDEYLKELRNVSIKGVTGEVRENCIFGGRGGMAYHIAKTFPEALVFPTEFRKFYMNEKTLEPYDDILDELEIKINQAIYNHVKFFIKNQKISENF